MRRVCCEANLSTQLFHLAVNSAQTSIGLKFRRQLPLPQLLFGPRKLPGNEVRWLQFDVPCIQELTRHVKLQFRAPIATKPDQAPETDVLSMCEVCQDPWPVPQDQLHEFSTSPKRDHPGWLGHRCLLPKI